MLKFWQFLLRRLSLIAAVIGISCLIALILAFACKPVYKNKATIWLNSQSLQTQIMSDSVASSSLTLPSSLGKFPFFDNNSIIDTFAGIITSRKTLEQVVDKLNLTDSDGEKISPDSLSNPNTLSLYFGQRKGVKTGQINDSEIIEITGYSDNPKEATDITNGVIDAFLGTMYNLNTAEARQAKAIVENQLKDALKRWKALDAEKKTYMNSHDVLDLETQKKNLLNIISTKENELLSLYADLEGKLSETKPEHPEMQAVKKKIEEYKNSIRDLNAKVRRLNAVDTRYSQLVVETDNYYALMKSLWSKYLMASLAQQATISNAMVVDRGIEPGQNAIKQYVAFPKKSKLLFIALFVGTVVGFSLAVFVDAIDEKVVTLEDVSCTGEKVLGKIPFDSRLKERLVPVKALADCRTTVSSALLCSSGAGCKMILPFSSLGSCEGKTTIARMFGQTLAAGGYRVIMVDADFSSRHLTIESGLEQNHGLTEYLSVEAGLNQVITKKSNSSFDLVPAGNKKEFLTSQIDGITKIIEELKDFYDVIILDLPSLDENPATVEILKRMGSFILVIKSGVHKKDSLCRLIRIIKEGNISIMGQILNFSKYNY